MPSLCRVSAVLLALGVCGLGIHVARSAEVSAPSSITAWKLPPLEGEITGGFRPLSIPNAPAVEWKVAVRALSAGIRAADVVIEGPGTRLRAELKLNAAGNGSWRIADAEIDLGIWSASAVGFLGEEFAKATAGGILRGVGEGTVQDGVLGGRSRVLLRGGRIEDSARKLLIEGLALDLTILDLAERESAPRQSLTWMKGHYDAIEFGRGHVDFTIAGEQVQVDESSVEVFGGEVVLAAFSFSTVGRETSVIARVIGVDVAYLLPLLPDVLSSAKGRLDGSLTFHRTQAGVRISGGSLALRAGETADLRLAPTPGLLSSALPETVLKYYPGLGKIETGEVPLRAEVLEVAFTPGGDEKGRTAVVRIVGGPDDPNLRAPIDLNINVRGPLESLIKFGTDSRLRFGGKP